MSNVSIVLSATCYICNKSYPVDQCTELIFESDSALKDEECRYVCGDCMVDLLQQIKSTLKDAMERLRKVNQNPSER